jgi:hypothetical protein
MTVHADLYEEKTGTRLYPGSLNVVLEASALMSSSPFRARWGKAGLGLQPSDQTLESELAGCPRQDLGRLLVLDDFSECSRSSRGGFGESEGHTGTVR